MAWNGASIRPPGVGTAPPASAAGTATPPPPAPANVILTGANFDPNDAISPYFLHPSENPSLVLVSSALNGQNYHPWARAMEMSLLSKNKLGFVDDTIPVPNVGEVRFSEADIFRISDLHAEIHQTRQGDLTVSAYFTKLKNLWDELQVIRPLPTCKCDRMCDCELLDTLQQHLENDNLSVFLRGLNETYVSVQSQIMMTKPLPTVDEAFMMVQ
ncbi:PREDICTED: uncharacterized protein LOC109160607 [Ipomoea nil]|uniref:uncharacterized protein LOC109160607 n=1 Tax=Ipomoea nil TaxID=35883 RepID=UPI000901563E|nr:PREDICTED: uncharacterized protein LOC109160607 [Ipomoea nil]